MRLRPVSQYSTKYHPAKGKTILDKRSDQGTRLRTRRKRGGFITFAPKTARRPPGGCGARKRISTRTSVREKLTRFRRRRQRGPAWRVQMARKVEDAREERGFYHFRPEDSEKAPGGCGACERISTRTSVREKSLEHASAPPGAFAASSSFAGCKASETYYIMPMPPP